MRRQLNFINGNEQLPEWKAYSLTGVCLRSPTRGNAVANFRPTSCLPFGWKLAIRNYLKRRLCSKGIRRTNGRALGVKAILEECKEIEEPDDGMDWSQGVWYVQRPWIAE